MVRSQDFWTINRSFHQLLQDFLETTYLVRLVSKSSVIKPTYRINTSLNDGHSPIWVNVEMLPLLGSIYRFWEVLCLFVLYHTTLPENRKYILSRTLQEKVSRKLWTSCWSFRLLESSMVWNFKAPDHFLQWSRDWNLHNLQDSSRIMFFSSSYSRPFARMRTPPRMLAKNEKESSRTGWWTKARKQLLVVAPLRMQSNTGWIIVCLSGPLGYSKSIVWMIWSYQNHIGTIQLIYHRKGEYQNSNINQILL